MSTGMQSHQPPPEKKGRMLPPEGVRVGENIGLFHLGGDRFVTVKVYPQHMTGEWRVMAHGKWSKHPVAWFATEQEAKDFVAEREKEDRATKERDALIEEGFRARWNARP